MGMEEEAAVARLQEYVRLGQPEAARSEFDRLAERHAAEVYAVCRRIVRDPERAQELAQDAWVTAAERLASFEGRSRFSTWVCGIAKLHCMNAVRKREDLLSEDGLVDPADPLDGSVLKSLSRAERQQLVREAAVAVLDELEQEAVYLRYEEMLPREEIAQILGLTQASGARGLLQRCSRKLRPELKRRIAELGRGMSFVRTTW